MSHKPTTEIDAFTNDIISTIKIHIDLGNKECIIPWNKLKNQYWFECGVKNRVLDTFYRYLTYSIDEFSTKLILIIDPPPKAFRFGKYFTFDKKEEICNRETLIQAIIKSTINRLTKMINDAVYNDSKSKKISKTFIRIDTNHIHWNRRIRSILKFNVKFNNVKLSFEEDPDKPNEVIVFIGTLNSSSSLESEKECISLLLRSLSTSFLL